MGADAQRTSVSEVKGRRQRLVNKLNAGVGPQHMVVLNRMISYLDDLLTELNTIDCNKERANDC